MSKSQSDQRGTYVVYTRDHVVGLYCFALEQPLKYPVCASSMGVEFIEYPVQYPVCASMGDRLDGYHIHGDQSDAVYGIVSGRAVMILSDGKVAAHCLSPDMHPRLHFFLIGSHIQRGQRVNIGVNNFIGTIPFLLCVRPSLPFGTAFAHPFLSGTA
eukprot:721010-Amorphochlora_amoeboformis.AAC.1